MIKWLMFGVLVFFAISSAQAMHHFNLQKADKRPIGRY